MVALEECVVLRISGPSALSGNCRVCSLEERRARPRLRRGMMLSARDLSPTGGHTRPARNKRARVVTFRRVLKHVKQHLNDVGKAIWGAENPLGAAWSEAREDELDAGQLDVLIREISAHASVCLAARQCAGYLDHNRDRMDYPVFRAKGLCTSTGVVEAGCKVAVGTRLKRAGMHWTTSGADAIIALRCCRLSSRFEDFWERWADRAA